MNYIEQDLRNEVVRFETSMEELSAKLDKPAKKIYSIKNKIQKINWSYVAIAAGLITSLLVFKFYKSR